MPQTLPTVNPLALLLILGLLGSVVLAWIWAFLQFAFHGRVVPRFDPQLVPWGGKSVLGALLAWLVIQVVALHAFAYVTRGTIGRPANGQAPLSPTEMMTNSAVQNGVVLLLIPAFLVATAGARLGHFVRPDRRSFIQIFQGMLAWPLAMPVVYGMMFLAVRIWGKESHPLETAIAQDGSGVKAIIFFLAGVICAPAAEELIFRGVLLGWLTSLVLRPGQVAPAPPFGTAADEPGYAAVLHPAGSESTGPTLPSEVERLEPEILVDDNPYAPPEAPLAPPEGVATRTEIRTTGETKVLLGLANVGVSFLFAALHYTVWPTPVPIFFLSLVLGVLYQRTGSLVAPVALHMTFNGISTVLMFLTLGPSPGPAPEAPAPTPLPKPVDPITKPMATFGPRPAAWSPASPGRFVHFKKTSTKSLDGRTAIG